MHDGPFEGKQSRANGSITSTGIKGDRLLSSFVITFAYMIKPCHAENPAEQASFVYQVINRGNGRATVFHKAQDYQAFLSILALAKAQHPPRLLMCLRWFACC